MIAIETVNDPFKSAAYQKALRIYHETKPNVEPGRVFVPRKKKSQAAVNLKDLRKKIADEQFSGNVHAVFMTDLKRENEEMVKLLRSTNALETVLVSHKPAPVPIVNGVPIKRGKLPKRAMPLHEFAAEQASNMEFCSSKSIYEYLPDSHKFNFKHALRCGRRTCAICGHFDSIDERIMIENELTDKLSALTREQKKQGRLVHIVLSHENVPLPYVMEIQKAWRHVQQMKKREYKKKSNPYDVWKILEWGLVRWEVTRDAKTGLYHPHLHIMAWANGWLAPEKGGYWYQLVQSWAQTVHLKVKIPMTNGQERGARATWKAQYLGAIAYFTDKPDEDPRAISLDAAPEKVREIIADDLAEMAKYPIKSTDWTKIAEFKEDGNFSENGNELARLLHLMHGRKLKNGFGDFKLREPEEEDRIDATAGEYEEEMSDVLRFECIFTWDKRSRTYKLLLWRDWNQSRFDQYLVDLADFKSRSALVLSYGFETS